MKRRPARPSPRSRPKSAPPRRGPAPISDRSHPNRPTPEPPAFSREATNVASPELLAEAAREIAMAAEFAVFQEGKRADRTLSMMLKGRRDLAAPDHRFISAATFALFRWKGWIDPIESQSPEERLLLSMLLDSTTIHPACKIWAKKVGRDPKSLVSLGDAPSWPARAEGFRRLLGGRAVTGDPWRLFPPWLRENLPMPPGGASPKAKYVELLQALQSRPSLWVRAQGADEAKTWDQLRELGVKPWIHRKISRAAKLEGDVDIYHLEPFTKGELEIQDLASQAVGLACDPDPGDRWWDACSGAGGKALHLATLMGGKGFVLATDIHERKLKEAVRRARRSPNRNLSTKIWDGKRVPAKPASFDGVLVDAPCSAIGTWRRNPDARWTIERQAIGRLAELQAQILNAASLGVKPGGTLVYSVCTLTVSETTGVVRGFLDSHADYRLDPFPHPLTGEPTDGMLQIWPQDGDNDAMFVARMVRST